jgi:hypothetical protein
MVTLISIKKGYKYSEYLDMPLRLNPEKVFEYFFNGKKVYFLITVLFMLTCFNSNAQDKKSSNNFSPNEKAIKSMLPPQLSYPANESVIDIQYPVLIWIPPRPISGMMVMYSLRLVEILKGQTLAEALLQNPPLINMSGLSNTFLNYPMDATPLRVDGHYAWQVAASYQGQSLGVTDMWSFSVKNNNDKKEDDIQYPVASKVSKERFYVTHGIFHFVYNNSAHENTLTYTIKSMDKSIETISGLPVIKLNPGMNKLQVDLQKSGKLKNGTYYYLEIKDKRQQVYKLMYYYVES